jgi:hypothetical protein
MASVGICLAICPVVKPDVMNPLRSVDSELARSAPLKRGAMRTGPCENFARLRAGQKHLGALVADLVRCR